MHRSPLLVGVACLLATSAHGQDLLQESPRNKHYQVYKEIMTNYDTNTQRYEELSSSEVNYLMTLSKGELQMRRVSKYKPMMSSTAGPLVCRLTGLKYLNHTYEIGTLFESYKGFYQSYPGGTMPPLRGLLNPGPASVGWAVRSDGSYTLRVRWFYGPKKNPEIMFNQSYFMYVLECKEIESR